MIDSATGEGARLVRARTAYSKQMAEEGEIKPLQVDTEHNAADALGKLVSARKAARTYDYLMNKANAVPPVASTG